MRVRSAARSFATQSEEGRSLADITTMIGFDPTRTWGLSDSRANGNYGISGREGHGLLRLDVGRPDHLAPFLGFVGDELAEVGGRAGKHRAARSASRALILGSARPALISLLSFSTISAGVFLGAPRPNQRSPRSPARTRPRSGCPAAPPSASPWSPPARAACRP